MKYLAIDYGQKRTGIAVSDTGGSMAFPRKTILMRTRAAFFEELLALIEAEATDAIVIGLPINLNGEDMEPEQASIDVCSEGNNNYTFVLNDHLKLQFNGGVNNIFNAFQKDLDKGADRDSKYFYGPTQPRTLFIGVKIFN